MIDELQQELILASGTINDLRAQLAEAQAVVKQAEMLARLIENDKVTWMPVDMTNAYVDLHLAIKKYRQQPHPHSGGSLEEIKG